MLKGLKSISRKIITNLNGWRTNRKLLVIESDDWGSIRMPSLNAYNILLNNGIRVNECMYNKYDGLESEDDLSCLFTVLSEFKDYRGNHPVITANTLMANPDFDKIRNSCFMDYHYEIFIETYKKYPKHNNTFTLWLQGLKNNLFFPQFHGREHLNIARWMKALKKKLPEIRLAFDLNLFGLSKTITNEISASFMEAFGFDNISEVENHKIILEDGLNIFEKIFGFKSKSFMAPNYTWHSDLDKTLFEHGILYFQGKGYQREPSSGQINIKKYNLGESNKYQQIYLKRNCIFEPSFYPADWVGSCLKDISTAFLFNKPAIIESHRLNYIGLIDPKNREKNLILLHNLLKEILKRWPDIEFITTVDLGNLIYKDIYQNNE